MNASLFMVLVVSGQIGGVWGPLPYDMDECQRRAAENNAEFLEKLRDPVIAQRARQAGHDGSTFTWRCERSVRRPQLGERRDNGGAR